MNREEQFEYLFQRYQRRAISFLMRQFRFSLEEAQDTAQETFLSVYRHMDQYRGDAEWSYVEKALRNNGLNKIRAGLTDKRNAVMVPIDKLQDQLRADSLSPAEHLVREEEAARLQAAIRQLPDSLRFCILHRLEDRSYDEIALLMKISVEAVRSRLRDARTRLRQLLAEEPGGIVWPEEPPEDQR